jgi:hypothetical protein
MEDSEARGLRKLAALLKTPLARPVLLRLEHNGLG